MTETLSSPPPPPPPHLPPAGDARRLVRDPDDQVVAGVCAAFARYTGTDPVLWRVTVAVLTLFGGGGLILYAAGWLLLPRAGQPDSVLERSLRRRDSGPGRIAVLVLAGVLLLGVVDDGPGFFALLVIGTVAYLVVRERRRGGGAPAAPAEAPSAVQYGPAAWREPAAPPAPPAWGETSGQQLYDPTPEGVAQALSFGLPVPEWTPPPRRRRSKLGAATLSAAALLAGLLLALGAVGVDGVTGARVLAATIMVVGAGLVVGTWWGRARWLIPVGLAMSLALVPAAVISSGVVPNGIGERTWVPTGVASQEFQLGAGEATLDLTRLDVATPAEITARIGVGALVVLVPDDLDVRVSAGAEVGEIRVLEDGERTEDGAEGTDLQETFDVGTPGDDDLRLDLSVGAGEIEVRRVAS